MVCYGIFWSGQLSHRILNATLDVVFFNYSLHTWSLFLRLIHRNNYYAVYPIGYKEMVCAIEVNGPVRR